MCLYICSAFKVCACACVPLCNLAQVDPYSGCDQLYYCQLKEISFAGGRQRKSVTSYLHRRKLVRGCMLMALTSMHACTVW